MTSKFSAQSHGSAKPRNLHVQTSVATVAAISHDTVRPPSSDRRRATSLAVRKTPNAAPANVISTTVQNSHAGTRRRKGAKEKYASEPRNAASGTTVATRSRAARSGGWKLSNNR